MTAARHLLPPSARATENAAFAIVDGRILYRIDAIAVEIEARLEFTGANEGAAPARDDEGVGELIDAGAISHR